MIRGSPSATLTDTLLPYETLFRSPDARRLGAAPVGAACQGPAPRRAGRARPARRRAGLVPVPAAGNGGPAAPATRRCTHQVLGPAARLPAGQRTADVATPAGDAPEASATSHATRQGRFAARRGPRGPRRLNVGPCASGACRRPTR